MAPGQTPCPTALGPGTPCSLRATASPGPSTLSSVSPARPPPPLRVCLHPLPRPGANQGCQAQGRGAGLCGEEAGCGDPAARAPGRRKAQCGGRHGTVGPAPQGQRLAVSVETGGRGVCRPLQGLQCKRAEGPRSTGFGGPRGGPRESPREGRAGPGRRRGQSRHAVRQARASEGTAVVSGRSG